MMLVGHWPHALPCFMSLISHAHAGCRLVKNTIFILRRPAVYLLDGRCMQWSGRGHRASQESRRSCAGSERLYGVIVGNMANSRPDKTLILFSAGDTFYSGAVLNVAKFSRLWCLVPTAVKYCMDVVLNHFRGKRSEPNRNRPLPTVVVVAVLAQQIIRYSYQYEQHQISR